MNKAKELLLVAGVIFLVMFPYIWKGQDVQVNVWDNLDSNVVWYKMLKDQGKIFAGPEVMVQGFVTETPRFSYPSGWNVEAVLYFLFPPFTAYWTNKLLIIIFAFVGMVLLFSRHLNSTRSEVMSIALLWATLAFNPHIGISVAGLPILVWGFYNLRSKEKIWYSFVVIVVYSFYSSMVLVGFFILPILGILLGYWKIVDGSVSFLALIGWFLMGACYFLQDMNLFYFLFLQDDIISHRVEMDYSYNSFSNKTPWSFIKNGDHNSVFYWWGYVVGFAGILVLFFLKGVRTFFSQFIPKKELFIFAIVFTLTVPFLAAALTWKGIANLAGEIFPVIHSFNLTRIAFLLPFFLFVVLAYGMIIIKTRYKKGVLAFFLGINIFVYQFEWRNWLNEHFNLLDYQVPSYRQYYAEEQFGEVKQFFGENWNDIHIANINLPPAASAYHGFKGIDGYLPLYNLIYKHQFCRIIIGELNKDRELFEHFTYWGNKCYLQNATYPDGFDAYKWKNLTPIEVLDLDFSLLQSAFRVDYLFSAVEVHHERLQLLKLFTHEESAWNIYVYEIKDEED
ncbi:MAG TPA: DUF6044 family protein [Aequorivita sp.]|nr:DUF6044 family protein [Aequorivita sp.]